MPRIERCDEQELISRKRGNQREWGTALVVLNGWLLYIGPPAGSLGTAYWERVLTFPLTFLFTLGLFLAGLLLIFPSELRIDFSSRTYWLVTEIDWLRLRPRGNEGSCDEIDHVRVDYQPESEGRSTWGWVSLVWKDPERPAYLLTSASLQIEDDVEVGYRFQPHRYGIAERIAERLGVPLVVVGVELDVADDPPIAGQESGYQT